MLIIRVFGLAIIVLAVIQQNWVTAVIAAVALGGVEGIAEAVRASWNGRGARNSSVCRHCGHDSGITASLAPICSACGRNRLVRDAKRALRT